MKTFIHALLASLAMTSGAAQAHYLWLEPAESGIRLYFGEADVLLKEKSPGRLDSITSPQAFVPESDRLKPAGLDRKAEYFVVNGKSSTVLVSEESIEVKDLSKSGLGFAKSNYYARAGETSSSANASLPLDLQFNGDNGFTLLYRGKPLAKAKLEVIAPNTWMQEHQTDDQGKVRINTPWRGQYVIHVLHVDKAPGEFGGRKYDNLRNHFTYTFSKAAGSDPGAAVPPSHPME